MNGTVSIFQVEGVVVRDAHQGPNFSYVTIREGEKQYWDVGCFEDGPLEQFRQLRSGAVARIRGHLGKRKIKGVVDPSGRPKYELQLVAERVKALAPAAPPPPPYPPPQQLTAYQGTPQQQYFYAQQAATNQGPWGAPPQQPPQHPAGMGLDDDLPF